MRLIKKVYNYIFVPAYRVSKLIRFMSILNTVGFTIFAKCISKRILRRYNMDISYNANIGRNVYFPHPLSIVIGKNVNIGDNVTIYQGVTLGVKKFQSNDYPSIGNDVIIGANSTLLGNILIGDKCIVGANSLVISSFDCNQLIIGNPAKGSDMDDIDH